MELTEIFGYVGAFVVGLVLGLTGGGGSIITVPVMVYLFSVNPVTATAYSLFVVGTTSLIGTFQNYKRKLLDFKTALIFALPAFTVVYITRRYLVPALPEVIFNFKDLIITKDRFVMLFFAIIMLLAAYSMIKKRKDLTATEGESTLKIAELMLIGAGVGLLTGIVGAGGGFLIIPALVLLAKLPMKMAIGTSLFIVTVNSLIGFMGDLQSRVIEWPFLLLFTGISIIGIIVGVYSTKFISGPQLKRGFGWFVLAMAIYIIFKEL